MLTGVMQAHLRGASASAPVTNFDPSTAVNTTLSGSNLIAHATGANGGVFVFASEGKTTGKYYFEVTLTTAGGYINGGAWGVSQVGNSVGGVASSTNAAILNQNGNIQSLGTTPYFLTAALVQGDTVGIAVDLGNRKVWFRKANGAGPWNGSTANGNPSSNVNGVNAPTGTIVPAVVFGSNLDTFTANFGATGFVGAVPSGYTAGWF